MTESTRQARRPDPGTHRSSKGTKQAKRNPRSRQSSVTAASLPQKSSPVSAAGEGHQHRSAQQAVRESHDTRLESHEEHGGDRWLPQEDADGRESDSGNEIVVNEHGANELRYKTYGDRVESW